MQFMHVKRLMTVLHKNELNKYIENEINIFK